ncbi:hypothetical protein CPB84DRAFT_1774571, partial [Gymnopilus junonius]
MVLPLHNCSYCPSPSTEFCYTCDRHLCGQHALKAFHECPTDGDAYNTAYAQTSNNNFNMQISSIDKSRILNNAIKTGRVGSVTVKDCHLDIPVSRDVALMGGKHLHLPLTFKNSDKWLVRLALQGGSASPQELLIQEMRSEVATLTALESVGMRIAKARSRCVIPRGARSPYFFLEWLDGKASFMDGTLGQQKSWITEIAKDFVKLEELAYSAIGCLTFTSDDGSDMFVGPMVEPTLCGQDSKGRLSQLGPFENPQEFRIAQVEQVLSLIEGGHKYSENALDAYLVHLEVIELIKVLYPKQQGPHLFYIRHADDKGDHWLFRGDCFLGTIDWEWAYTTTKEEAFAAPLAFIDIGAFYDGQNNLSDLENAFAGAFDLLQRPDLAMLVRGGKKYQRLPFVIGTDFFDLPNLFLAFRQLVLGQDSKPTFGEWKKEAWEKYKDHSFLASQTMS